MKLCPNEVHVKAPCKLLLSGEHAVVFGRHALALALDLNTHVRIQRVAFPAGIQKNAIEQISTITLNLHSFKHSHTFNLASLRHLCVSLQEYSYRVKDGVLVFKASMLRHILACCSSQQNSAAETLAEAAFVFMFVAIMGNSFLSMDHCFTVDVTSDVPVGAGLGSSAAYSVGIALALLEMSAQCISTARVNAWAFEAERIIHGTPSGVDNTVIAYGGAVMYSQRSNSRIESVPNLRMLIVNTNVSRSTKNLVASVDALHRKLPVVSNHIFDAIDAIVMRLVDEFSKTQLCADKDSTPFCAHLLEMNQHLLHSLGVSHVSIDHVVKICHDEGITAKLTGAGGGGCVVALLPFSMSSESLAVLRDRLKTSGFTTFEANLSSAGARILPVEIKTSKLI